MSLIADGLLIATGLTAGLYCFILSRRLKAFSSTDSGVGQQIRQLNSTLEETRAALREAQSNAEKEAETLARNISQARKLSTQLTNLIANAEDAGKTLEQASATQQRAAPQPPVAKSTAAKPIGIPTESDVPADAAEDDAAEIEDMDPGAVSFEEALSETDGDVQLGFLPDEDLDASNIEEEDARAVLEDARPSALQDDEERSVDVPPTAADENLLKVERMAL